MSHLRRPRLSEQDRHTIYTQYLQRITEPTDPAKRKWGDPAEATLALCIVECRKHPWLPYVLYNACRVYGGDPNITLYIFHGTQNKEYVEGIVGSWSNVVLYNIQQSELTTTSYTVFMKSLTMWVHIASEWTLWFTVETLFRRPIPSAWYSVESSYDYIGVPWSEPPTVSTRTEWNLVGDGRCSLRRKTAMLDVCRKYFLPQYVSQPEDIYFCSHLPVDRIAPFSVANEFAMGSVVHPDPMNTLRLWEYPSLRTMIHLMETT